MNYWSYFKISHYNELAFTAVASAVGECFYLDFHLGPKTES